MEKTGVPGENHRPATGHWQTLLHHGVSSASHLSGDRAHNLGGNHDTFNSTSLYIVCAESQKVKLKHCMHVAFCHMIKT
jgi:hypothetical protein